MKRGLKAIGRSRDLEKEIRVMKLLAEGLSINLIARETGVHRNTVRNMRMRTPITPDSSSIEQFEALRGNIQRLEQEAAENERQRLASAIRLRQMGYYAAIQRLISSVEKAIQQIEKSRSVWTGASLDRPLSKDGTGTMHDLLSGSSVGAGDAVENSEISQLLSDAMASLSEVQRRVIQLSVVDGADAQKISELTGMTPTEVAAAQSSGLSALRDSMKGAA